MACKEVKDIFLSLLLSGIICTINAEDSLVNRGIRSAKDPVIHTELGAIRGLRRPVLDRFVDVFYGIPFAKPPVGHLRFRKPEPLEAWQGVLDATHLPKNCVQEFDSRDHVSGISEDCLYLNIWVPAAKSTTVHGRDVFVWIHGGWFVKGSSTLEIHDGALFSATKDIILVSFNYRLGPFGFLYLGTEEAPGNMGLLDQVLALSWIKRNIEKFGGNPDSVTLMGVNAGGVSVSAHILSPLSRSLSKHAVIQSGSVFADWSIMSPEASENIAKNFTQFVGCDLWNNGTAIQKDGEYKMIGQCLQKVSSMDITNAVRKVVEFTGKRSPFVVTLDGYFLPHKPQNLLRDGDFKQTGSVMVGHATKEGSLLSVENYPKQFGGYQEKTMTKFQTRGLINDLFPNSSPSEKSIISYTYTDWTKPGDEAAYRESMEDLLGDIYAVCPSSAFASALAEHGVDVYFYQFDPSSSRRKVLDWTGNAQSMDMQFFIWYALNYSISQNKIEQDFSHRILDHIDAFARTGTPSNENFIWPKYTKENPDFIVIKTEHFKKDVGPRARHCALWNDLLPGIYNEHGNGNSRKERKNIIFNFGSFADYFTALMAVLMTV